MAEAKDGQTPGGVGGVAGSGVSRGGPGDGIYTVPVYYPPPRMDLFWPPDTTDTPRPDGVSRGLSGSGVSGVPFPLAVVLRRTTALDG